LPDGPEMVVHGSGIDKGVCAWLQDAGLFSRSSPVTVTERYVRIVVLTDHGRHRINGDMVRSDLARTAQWLPQVVGVTFLGYDLVVADYDLWKQKVSQRQQVGGDMP
jgi:hypothetical protein